MSSSPSSEINITDDAKFRRGIAALQRFSQNKRKSTNHISSNKPCSSMRYSPFSEVLFSRKRVGIEEILLTDDDDDADNGSGAAVGDSRSPTTRSKSLILFDVLEYTHIPSGLKLPPLLERNELSAATVADLKAARLGAIDNTGSFHWPAEDILGHLLLMSSSTSSSSSSSKSSNDRDDDDDDDVQGGTTRDQSSSSCLFDFSSAADGSSSSSVLEIGAGVGLAGFALALSGKVKHVIVTDGNKRVAKLLKRNSEAVSSEIRKRAVVRDGDKTDKKVSPVPSVAATCLRWQIVRGREQDEESARARKVLQDCQYLVGADCLFFETFHNDLVHLVLHFLRASTALGSTDNNNNNNNNNNSHINCIHNNNNNETMTNKSTKKVIFVAPSRGGSRERFLAMLDAAAKSENAENDDDEDDGGKHSTSKQSNIRWSILDRYDETIYQIHRKHLETAEETGYNVDRHFPHVVVIENVWK